MASDGELVLSHCLAGRLIVWDGLTGEIISRIERGEERGSPPARPAPPRPAPTRGGRSSTKKSSAYLKLLETFSEELGEPKVAVVSGRCAQQAVWCTDLADGLVVAGCAGGRLEVWHGRTGRLLCQQEEGRAGATHVRLLGRRLVVARLDGLLEFYELAGPRPGSPGWVTAPPPALPSPGSTMELRLRSTARAHLQSISCLAATAGRLLTGSADHTLRVFRPEDGLAVYTLHGHTGPVTAVFLDRSNPASAGSASQDGVQSHPVF